MYRIIYNMFCISVTCSHCLNFSEKKIVRSLGAMDGLVPLNQLHFSTRWNSMVMPAAAMTLTFEPQNLVSTSMNQSTSVTKTG